MLAFILRRLGQSVLVMLAVALISFALFRYVGDPIAQLVGVDTGAAQREALRRELGLNDAVPVQFARFLGQAARGDFGISYQFKKPVAELLAERMPATLELAMTSTLFALLLGIPMGVYTGIRRNSWAS